MAAFRRGPIFLSKWMQCRGKYHTHRKRPIHLQRRIMEAVAAPILPRQNEFRPSDICSVLKEEETQAGAVSQKEENLYKQFLMRQCRKHFAENNMIIIFQQISMKEEELKVVRNKLRPLDIYLYQFHYEIVTEALQDTKWTNLDLLLHPRNLYVFSAESKVTELVKACKRLPEIMMLGGVVNDVMYTKAGLQRLGELPSLDVLLGQTVATLNMAVGKTHSLLGSHQQQLAHNLEQYVKDQGGGTETVQPETPSDSAS